MSENCVTHIHLNTAIFEVMIMDLETLFKAVHLTSGGKSDIKFTSQP